MRYAQWVSSSFLFLLLPLLSFADSSLKLWIVVFQLLLPDRLHKLVHLCDLLICASVSILCYQRYLLCLEEKKEGRGTRTTHLVNLGLVHFVTPPFFSFDLLCVALPFCEEADLLLLCQSVSFLCLSTPSIFLLLPFPLLPLPSFCFFSNLSSSSFLPSLPPPLLVLSSSPRCLPFFLQGAGRYSQYE